jgi:tetratricopeptide (TPR) repeat protein
MNTAEQLEQSEKYEEAYAEYKKILMHKPDDVDVLTRIAHVALILDNKTEAKQYYAKILEVDPSNIMAHEQLLDLFVNEDKFKYYLLRGNMHALQQQMSYANSDYKKAISHAKDAQEALPARYLHAGLCEGQEKYQEAIDEYLRIADYDDKNPMVFLKLAELYDKTEGIISAIQTLERGKKENGFTEYDEVLAGYYIKNSQPDKALAITKNELTKARALFDMGDNEKGYEVLMNAKGAYEKNPTFYSLLAQYYFQKEMYDESFDAIKKFEELAPNSPLIYQMRALIYEQKNDSFNEHLNWGKYNVLRNEKDVALNEYMTAYRFNNSDADLVETIAVMLETDGDKTKASEFYERLADIDPKNTNALQKLAEFRESIGDNGGALDYLEKLKAIDPRNEYVAKNYECLQNGGGMGDGGLLSLFKGIFGRRMR